MPTTAPERFSTYSLSGLLPEDDTLVLDHELHILSQYRQSEHCSLLEQQLFTVQEWRLVSTILACHPYYCPFADVLSAHSGKSLHYCQQVVNRALQEGDLDQVIRPARNVLSRARSKVRLFGIDIKSLLETGYMLLPDKKSLMAAKQAP